MPDDILLEVASRDDYRETLRQWADLLVKMDLTHIYGVYAKSVPVADIAIYLSRHDISLTPGNSETSQECHGG